MITDPTLVQFLHFDSVVMLLNKCPGLTCTHMRFTLLTLLAALTGPVLIVYCCISALGLQWIICKGREERFIKLWFSNGASVLALHSETARTKSPESHLWIQPKHFVVVHWERGNATERSFTIIAFFFFLKARLRDLLITEFSETLLNIKTLQHFRKLAWLFPVVGCAEKFYCWNKMTFRLGSGPFCES